MKTKIFISCLIFSALMFSACTAALNVPAETDVPSGQAVNSTCSRSSDEVRLLINSVHQFCLQYPDGYDVFFPNENEIMLIQRSMLNVSEPRASIKVLPAGGMAADQAADSFLAVYSLPVGELIRETLTIDDEEAIMLDKLPGQEINRQVFVVHNDTLYQLSFMPVNESRPGLYAQMETLYNTVITSFNFHPESNACPDCPMP